MSDVSEFVELPFKASAALFYEIQILVQHPFKQAFSNISIMNIQLDNLLTHNSILPMMPYKGSVTRTNRGDCCKSIHPQLLVTFETEELLYEARPATAHTKRNTGNNTQ